MHVIVRIGGGTLLLGVVGVFTNRVAMEISAGQLFLWFDRSAWVAVINYAKNIDYRAEIVPVNRKFTSPRHLRDSSQLAWSAKQGFLYPWRQVFYYVTPKQWNFTEQEKEKKKNIWKEKKYKGDFFLDHSVSFTLFLLILRRSPYLSIYFRLFYTACLGYSATEFVAYLFPIFVVCVPYQRKRIQNAEIYRRQALPNWEISETRTLSSSSV